MGQKNVTLTTTPTAVAEGPGNATFQTNSTSAGVKWWVDTSAPADAEVAFFFTKAGTLEPVYVADGQALYLAGRGDCAVNADVEPS